MIETPALIGKRVRLEPLSRDAVPGLVIAASGPRDSYDYALVPPDIQGMTSYVDDALADQRQGESVPLVIFDAVRDEIVGSTRFMDIVYWGPDEGVPSAVEIGSTWLAASAQRTGINTEMKLLMLGYAFEDWKVHRVTLKTDSRNQRSRAAMERIGCRYEGIRRAHIPALDGGIRDTAYYSVLRAEWPEVRDHLAALIAAHAPR
ncbi:MAG: GNAT family N-acetyltransferase [Actinobacteria bacterium]|nr:GNAT family N-acetyltransferase [Actinomycetota bacterium]